ncbi:MAG: putative e Multidrug resistance protein 2 (Multidrug-efflux transporter 2) [Acidimicrobiaceae bacterium]|nr:putative e Multidrug resistance protein 2 (Multidrug-efflux transporter 2) [Acidimicrobiaceae bacterium]
MSLSAATLLLWIGGSAILPLLPTYLRRHGSDPALVGVVMAAYFAASVATQYPVGRLSDRVGRRPVVLAGLVVFAVGSVGFAVATGAGPAIVCRALQGIGAGAVTVAAAATIGTEVAPAERGAAFGALYGSQMLALAIGPLVGSIVGEQSMGLLFVVAAIAAIVAAIPVLAVVPAGRATLQGPDPACYQQEDAAARGDRRERLDELEALAACLPGGVANVAPARERPQRSRLRLSAAFVGVLVVFGATGLVGGVYESCWTLLMVLRHASSFQIGLSWTLFALPFAALSVPAGHLADRYDRRRLVLVALLCSAGFCALYPFLHSVVLLVVFCTFEAVGSVVGTPAAVLVLTRSVPASAQGEAQGSVETARMAATALAAAASGALFGVDPLLPFMITAVVVLLASIGIAVAWRSLPIAEGPEFGSEPVVAGSVT